MSRNDIPDASRPHEVTVVFWLPEEADPREFLRRMYEVAEEEWGAESISDTWEEA